MRFPSFFGGRREYALEPLTIRHSAAISELHREDFNRPWSEEEFLSLIRQNTVFGHVVRETSRKPSATVGFVLARLAAGEAEILTVAVSRAHRKQGLGRQLMDAVLRDLHRHRAETLFLEVDEINAPAIALYRKLGFREVGKRPGYYEHAGRNRTGALIMRRELR